MAPQLTFRQTIENRIHKRRIFRSGLLKPHPRATRTGAPVASKKSIFKSSAKASPSAFCTHLCSWRDCPKSPKSLLGQLLFPWRAPAPAVGLGCPGCNTASAFSDEVTSTVAEAYYPIQRPLKARCASMGTRVHIHPVENVRLRRTTFYTDELMWDKVE